MMHRFSLPPPINLLEAFQTKPPPPDFVIPGLVAGTIGALVAPGATGKSFWALGVAATVAGARDHMRLGITTHGRVLLVALEDPESILISRLHSMGGMLSQEEREAVTENLDVMPALALGIDLYGGEAERWAEVIAERGVGCRLILVDTVSRAHSGEENSRTDAARVMRLLEIIAARTGAALLFMHHITKVIALNRLGDQPQAARGSTVWIDESRWAGFLKTMDGPEAKEYRIDTEMRKNFVRFGVNKANYCPAIADIWLRRDVSGLLMQSDVIKANVSTSKTFPCEVNDDNDF